MPRAGYRLDDEESGSTSSSSDEETEESSSSDDGNSECPRPLLLRCPPPLGPNPCVGTVYQLHEPPGFVAASSVVPSTVSTSPRRKKQPRVGVLDVLFAGSPRKSKPSVARPPTTPRRHTTASVPTDSASRVSSLRSPSSMTNNSTAPTRSPKHKRRSSTSVLGAFFTPLSPPKKQPPRLVTCITCRSDDLPTGKTAKLDCGHRMCHTCLKRLFALSTTDPQLMPPRCCNTAPDGDGCIPLRHVEHLLSDRFKRLWNSKYAEYTTKNRLYCPKENCSHWIRPKYIKYDRETGRRYGTCKVCSTKACKKCGRKWHGLKACKIDDGTECLLSLGKAEGWQRCYSCKAMVQLAEGCNHMKCRCNAEFCYVCGEAWKTCDCPWFQIPPGVFDEVEWPELPLGGHFVQRDQGQQAGYRREDVFIVYEVAESNAPATQPPRPPTPQRTSFTATEPPPSTEDSSIQAHHRRSRRRDKVREASRGDSPASSTPTSFDPQAQEALDGVIARQLQEEEDMLLATAGLGVEKLRILDTSREGSPASAQSRSRRARRRRLYGGMGKEDEEVNVGVLDEEQAGDDEWMTRLRPVKVGEDLHGEMDAVVGGIGGRRW